MKFAVTVGKNEDKNLPVLAKAWAKELLVNYLQRKEKGTLKELLEEKELDCLIVATKNGPQIVSKVGTLFYHPGMAVLRLGKLLKGDKDNFVDALELLPGKKVLDCTLGFAADACIASFVVGKTGKVVGLEASQPLSFLLKNGLKTYKNENNTLIEALRRIEVINTKAEEYLQHISKNSFDVVYFDPMFRHPIEDSAAMKPLRPIAYERTLNKEVLEEALKVAPLVVVKERSLGVFNDLGIREIVGGKYSKIKYGILRR